MITVSLCMIVKNEEATLGRCLESVKGIFDETIIVDTGSADSTKETAAGYADKVLDFKWCDDFSAARNYAYEQAEMEYVMWLDADDVLLPADAAKLTALKNTLTPETDAVMMKYNLGLDEHGDAALSFYRERLTKRSRGFKWREPIHEHLEIGGKVLTCDICITHKKNRAGKTTRNIEIYEKLLKNGETLTPRGEYYYARELAEHGRYKEAADWFNTFLDSGKGWLEDNIAACIRLCACYTALDMPDEAFAAVCRSFSYDLPRAEACCRAGYCLMKRGKYRTAAFWFELALKLTPPENNWGFCEHDYLGYIPCVELAVCHDRLGEYEKALEYNERAGEYKPTSPVVAHNRLLLRQLNSGTHI